MNKEQAADTVAIAATRASRSMAKKMSSQPQEYMKALAMPSAELGAVIKTPTENIAKHIGSAMAHEAEAKMARAKAHREFAANIGYYYEVKQRLLNPGHRADLDGGKDRTPEDNQKYFGAADWASFVATWVGYSLQHADRKLKEFARKNGLLTESDDSSDDFESHGDAPAGPQPRRNNDATPQKRYEFIATAAMDIANRNPEGEVEKQILAAAEHEPAPLMPVPPDVFTEVLSFITKISSLVTDDDVRSEARRLIGKMLLHRPVPDATKILSEAMEEEARKRNKRLPNKNGRALGSENYNPPPPTSEHVQRFEVEAQERSTETDESAPATAPDDGNVVPTAAPAANAPTESYPEAVAEIRKPVSSVKVTTWPSACETESERNCERNLAEPSTTPPTYVGCKDLNSVPVDINVEDFTSDCDSECEEPPCSGTLLHPCFSEDWIRCDNCHEMLCMEHGNPHAVYRPTRPSAAPDFLCDECAEAAESRGEIQPNDDGYEYVDYDVA